MVELGAKSGDVRLIEVNEGGVVLQGEHGKQALTLFPGVRVNRKAAYLSMENEVRHSVRSDEPEGRAGGQARREGK
jgi:hypothetical protein